MTRNYFRLLWHKTTRWQIPLLVHNYFHAEKVTDFFQLPIIINNYNRLDCLLRLTEFLTRRGYHNIYIIDNCSTYPPLLEWYGKCPFNVIRLNRNVGHLSFNETNIHKMFANQYYVYTDPDVLPVESCPDDFLRYFWELMQRYPQVVKVGFSLKIDDLPDHFAHKSKVVEWESQFWKKQLEPDVYVADIDTTFALHRPNWMVGCDEKKGMRLRTGGDYTARHLPWYIDSANPDAEEVYYQNTIKTSTHWSEQSRFGAADRPKTVVTVCIPTYNQERYIGDAIRGALEQQTSFPVEILVSDDASTDNTLAVCRQYAEQYPDKVRLLTAERNVGMIANYDKLYRAAEGQYIAFCDGDDYWTDPLKLQRQVDFLDRNPGYSMCYAKCKTYSMEESCYKDEYGWGYQSPEEILYKCQVPALTAMCRNSLVKAYLDDPVMADIRAFCSVTADYPMWLYMGLRGKVHFQDDVVAVFRIFKNSGSHSSDRDKELRFEQTIWYMTDRFVPLYMRQYGYKRTAVRLYRLRMRQSIQHWCRSRNPIYKQIHQHYYDLLPRTEWGKYLTTARYRLKSGLKSAWRSVAFWRTDAPQERS